MNLLQPWNVVFLAGLIVYFQIRRAFIRRLDLRKTPKVVSHFGRLEKALLFAMFVAVLVLPMLYLCTPLLDFADYRLPVFLPPAGTLLMLVSLWMFWMSHADLAENWSVTLEVREGHQLVQHGIYRSVRHPMYASIWLWAFAQGLMLPNWLAGWAVVPAFAAMYFTRVAREEQMLCDALGDAYRQYMRHTGRLFPRWRRSG